MNPLVHIVIRYGAPLVALNVFLEQMGAPIPAVPTLIIAGALSRDGKISSTQVLVLSVAASLLADWIWFALGRRYGFRILRTLCRVSLSPDSCVRDTESSFERWGMKSLLVAKFIPGFSTVAPPLAGATRRSTMEFLFYDTVGAFLWAGAAVAVGRAFHRAVDRILSTLGSLGWWSVVFVTSLLVLVVMTKWWQRARFFRQLRVARIDPATLAEMLRRGESPVVLDVRTGSSRRLDPRRVPTAILATADDIAEKLRDVAFDREIVLYCT